MKLKETSSNDTQQQLLQRLEPLFGKGGYKIVELHYAALKHKAHFSIVLFHPTGISIESCAELHKIADVEIERLQANGLRLSESNDYSLELTSPGLGRRLRSCREFEIFRGQQVRCLVGNTWHRGLLLGLDTRSEELSLELNKNSSASNAPAEVKEHLLRLPLEQVLKVELDS